MPKMFISFPLLYTGFHIKDYLNPLYLLISKYFRLEAVTQKINYCNPTVDTSDKNITNILIDIS